MDRFPKKNSSSWLENPASSTKQASNSRSKSSGIGDASYVPKSIGSSESAATMKEGRAEASTVIFGALDELFQKTRVRPKDVGILVVNCGLFHPKPSLSAMIINHYQISGNILNFNLRGMGCSAGIVGLDLECDMLQANPRNYAVVVSAEMVGYNRYPGKERSMLVSNCYFRMGCSAVMLSDRLRDYSPGKYRLEHIVRMNKGSGDRSYEYGMPVKNSIFVFTVVHLYA